MISNRIILFKMGNLCANNDQKVQDEELVTELEKKESNPLIDNLVDESYELRRAKATKIQSHYRKFKTNKHQKEETISKIKSFSSELNIMGNFISAIQKKVDDQRTLEKIELVEEELRDEQSKRNLMEGLNQRDLITQRQHEKDGCLYTGQWNMNTKVHEGYGRLDTYQNGDLVLIQIGYFKNNEHYYGGLIYPHVGYYIGEVNNNKAHGYGRYTTVLQVNDEKDVKLTYAGMISEGIVTGEGTVYYSNSKTDPKYTGSFIDGLPTGQCTILWEKLDSCKYQGKVRNGKLEDNAEFTTPNGHVYKGVFLDNTYTGEGRYSWQDESHSQFVGKYKRDKRVSGEYSDDSYRFKGNFVNGVPHGKGIVISNSTNDSCEALFQYGRILKLNSDPNQDHLAMKNVETWIASMKKEERIKDNMVWFLNHRVEIGKYVGIINQDENKRSEVYHNFKFGMMKNMMNENIIGTDDFLDRDQ